MHVSLRSDDGRESAAGGVPAAGSGDSGSGVERITRLAAYCLRAPAAAVCLLRGGQLQPKAAFGLAREAGRAVCRLAELVLAEGREVVMADAGADAPDGFRFLAGAPIRTRDGWTLGALCVLDQLPRQPTVGTGAVVADFAQLAVAELSIRQDRVLTLFDDSSDVILVYGFDGRLLAFNTAAERATGFSRMEVLSRRLDEMVVSEQRPLIGQAVLEAFGGAVPDDQELTLLTKDDRRIVLEFRSRLVFRDGHPVAVQAVGRDVTLCRRAEQQRDRTTAELARYSEHLRQLHRLSTTGYESLEHLIRDYLRTGCDMLGLAGGRLTRAEGGPAIEFSCGARTCDSDPAGQPCRSIQAPVPVNGDIYGQLRFCSPDSQPHAFGAHDTQVVELIARGVSNSVLEAGMRAQLAYQATHDPLTGLINRSSQHERLDRVLAAAAEDGTLVAVALLDLDRFKQVNDTFGHSFGDVVLKRVAERMTRVLSPRETLARVGGDEFTVVFADLRQPEQAIQSVHRLLAELRSPFELEGYEFVITASVGLSFYPADGRDAETLLRHADAAMYRAKSRGKNDVECFVPESVSPGLDRLDLETQLRHALENREFELLYQPEVDSQGRLHGLEVLLAWNSPKLGRILPGKFIPVAEECGLIVPIGEWVLREACLQGARWLEAGRAPARIAVNVSALQFARTDFFEMVAEALEAAGLPPGSLELEITESLIMRDVEESAWRMAKLRALGVSIAIDDFGTGYSSLSYLRQLPVDALKIDQSFLPEIESANGTLPLIQTIVALAHHMGLSVLAEGVENERQARLVYEAGCDRAQGHFFGGPLCVAEASRRLSGESG